MLLHRPRSRFRTSNRRAWLVRAALMDLPVLPVHKARWARRVLQACRWLARPVLMVRRVLRACKVRLVLRVPAA